jgi:L-amino acid N-acyltransferase YncA
MNEKRIEDRFPKTTVLKDGTKVLLKAMTHTDRDALHQFFSRIPEQDRKFLKHDVSRKDVIDSWLQDINYGRVFPVLAEVDGKIVADATLHRRSAGWLKHVAEVRLVVDPAYRHKGLGSHLLEEIIMLAIDAGVEKLVAEIVAEERAAIRAFQRFNFEQVAVLPGIVKDQTGRYQDLVVMVLDVPTAFVPDWFYF